MIRVLDAFALIAYLEKEQGYEKVKEALSKATDSEKKLLMSTVNWGEVYYILVRHYDLEKAGEILRLIETFPVELVPADEELTKQAALYKALKKLPYADSFAASLTKIPLAAALPEETMIAIGVASPKAHGQAIIKTATKFTSAKLKAGAGPNRNQTIKVRMARTTTTGTK